MRVGADLLSAIEEAVKREKIEAGVIVSGIGALNRAIFRNLVSFPEVYPVSDDNRLYLDVETPLELLSLGGWIAPRNDGAPEIHCHFSASTVRDGALVTYGGHLTRGTVAGIKVVIAIAEIERKSVRADFDDFTQSMEIWA